MHISRQIGFLVLLSVGAAAPAETRSEQRTPDQRPESAQQSKPAQQTDRRQAGGQQGRIKRLILKDGSYELISKHEIKGERVRYLSSERHEWEDMPYSLVDWPATEKFAKEAASENRSRLRQFGEREAEERANEEAYSPLISPGIRLPKTGGVFLLDLFQGKPELNQLRQNGADINKNMGGNILRAIINPVPGVKQTIELKGLQAAVQSHVAEPSIYISIDSNDPVMDFTPETAKDHFRIARCEERKGNRIVGVVNIAIYGKAKEQANYIETEVEPVSGPWVRISPVAQLQPGEYALIELLGKQDINTIVWDFGVNASAPRNADAVKPEAGRSAKPPVLVKRRSKEQP